VPVVAEWGIGVQIRGYRIELGEIESVIQRFEGVSQCVVIARSEQGGTGKRLVGYVVCEGELDKERLNAHVRSELPEYMVPSMYMAMEQLPLTPNGKVDKKALPDVEFSTAVYEVVSTETERKLQWIWSEILGLQISQIGAEGNFFELGGHSLLSMRVASWIRKELQIEVPIQAIFSKPTLRSLASYIDSQEKRQHDHPLVVKDRPSRIPLSYSQERLWFIDKLQGSVNYHIPIVLKLEGPLEIGLLEKSIRAIVERHEVLRTVYHEQDGQAYQQVLPSAGWHLIYEEGVLIGSVEEEGIIRDTISTPFDLSTDMMIRARVLELKGGGKLLILVTHHIASDGWSQGLFVDELVEHYESYRDQRGSKVAEVKHQYIDYALWQRRVLSGPVLEEKLLYWEKKLGGLLPLDLPTDMSRPSVQSTRGGVYSFELGAPLSVELDQLSQRTGTTLFMTLLSAFQVMLYRYTGQADICVGTPIAGRTQKELEPLIGFFVNTLAIRSDLSGNPEFTSLLQQVKETALEAFTHQDVPFEKVVERVEQSRDLSRTPVFQVMFLVLTDQLI